MERTITKTHIALSMSPTPTDEDDVVPYNPEIEEATARMIGATNACICVRIVLIIHDRDRRAGYNRYVHHLLWAI
jgi:hypothetical protein